MVRKIKKRSTLKPREVRFLNNDQIGRIVELAVPGRSLPPAQIALLEQALNFCLSGLHSPVNHDEIPDVSEVKRLLARLAKSLKPKQLWLLEAIGRSYQRMHDPLRGYVFLDDSVRDTVAEFSRDTTEILKWLQCAEAEAAVITSLKPAANLEFFIAVELPTIFEQIFEQKCGIARAGAGSRFITAVLRESNIRSPIEPDERIADAVRKCRERHKRKA